MRYTRLSGSRFALWPLFVLFVGHFRLIVGQDHFNGQQLQIATDGPETDDQQETEAVPLATGKWNQFKGFFTPRPLPANAHFTFASVWASWSAWSYCTNNIQIRVRACNTVRGFSCLGPNREVRPCENPTPPPKRFRQFQVPIREPGELPQYDADDPWVEDRQEALKQLYHTNNDYDSQKEAQQKEGARPEAFASKLHSPKKQVKSMESQSDSMEEMNLEELAEKLDVKKPNELAEKLADLEESEEIQKMPKTMPTTPSSTTTTEQPTTTEIEENMVKIEQRPTNFGRGSGDAIRVRPATPFTTSSTSPPSRTTMTEPRYRPERIQARPRQQMTDRERTILAVMERQKLKSFRRSGEIENRSGKLQTESSTTTTTSTVFAPTAISEDTARALEWIMANMSKSIESARSAEKIPKSSQQDGSKAKSEEFPVVKLHSGESMVEADEIDNSAVELTPKPTTSTQTLPRGRAKAKSRAMAVNSFRMQSKSGKEDDMIEIRQEVHQQQGVLGGLKELSKAQRAKQRQIEQSREQIQHQSAQQSGEKTAEMERELARLRAEMRAMEAVLARMKADGIKVEKPVESASESEEVPEFNHDTNQRPKLPSKEISEEVQKPKPKIVFPSKTMEKPKEEAKPNMQPQIEARGLPKSVEITAKLRPKATSTESTTQSPSLIVTERPGSVPKASTAKWSQWGEWGQCICGKQMRSRNCLFDEDSAFHSQGCMGASYESRACTATPENCPTTIPPIPPSKQRALLSSLNDGQVSRQNRPISRTTNGHIGQSNLRRTPLSIAKSAANGASGESDMRLPNERMRFWWRT